MNRCSLALVAAFSSMFVVSACSSSDGPESGFNPVKDAGGSSPVDAAADAQVPPIGNDDSGTFGPLPDGGGNVADAADCAHEIVATIRDFQSSKVAGGHPDFENDAFSNTVSTKGLVKDDLGSDSLPAFLSTGTPIKELTGPTEFAQWYKDVPNVNQAFQVTLPLTESPPGSGVYKYSNDAFFPIDGKGFGNTDGQGGNHNFHFTTEVHVQFTYNGGEVFSFDGDDDLWIFINKKLAIDLGGLHPQLADSANLDALATKLGITKGGDYPMDIFHAERHRDQSHFNVTTTIKCFTPAVPPR